MIKNFIIAAALFLAACASTGLTPEAQLKMASDTTTTAAIVTTNLLKRDRIDVQEATTTGNILTEVDYFLTLAEQDLRQCRDKNPKPETGIDPCAKNLNLKLSQDLLIKIEEYLRAKESN